MKLPRDISGSSLIKLLDKLGYTITRQTSSHIRLTTEKNGEHHITVPAHKNIKVGTLNSILLDVANHFKITKEELLQKLF